MTAAQPDLEPDDDGDGDAIRSYLSRLLQDVREAEQQAQAARARAMAVADRIASLRRAGREPRKGARRGS